MAFQADAGDRVDEIAEVDSFGRGNSRDLAKRMALGPFEQGLAVPLVPDLEGRAHVLLKPGDQIAKEAACLRFVGGLGMAGGCRGQVEPRRIAAQRFPKAVVGAGQVEEHLVRLLLVIEPRRFVGLDEIEIEVARRHRRGPFVRRAEEQVTSARRLACAPFELVLPDAIAGDVGLVGALHHAAQGIVVVPVQPRRVETRRALLDQGIEVVGLLEVEIELAVVRVRRNELAADGPVDLPQDCLHLRQEVVGRIAPEILDTRLIEAQTVPQLLGGGAEGGMDVAGGQPVHRQCVDDAHRHRLVRRPGERLLNSRLQHLAAIDDRLDVGNGPERCVFPQG